MGVTVYPAFDWSVSPCRNRLVVVLDQSIKRVTPRLGQIFREGLQGLPGLLNLLRPSGRGRALLHREGAAGFLKPGEGPARLVYCVSIWILMQWVALDSFHHNPSKIDVADGVTNRKQLWGEIWVARLSDSPVPSSLPSFDRQFHHAIALIVRGLHPSGCSTAVLPNSSKGHEVRELFLVLHGPEIQEIS